MLGTFGSGDGLIRKERNDEERDGLFGLEMSSSEEREGGTVRREMRKRCWIFSDF